MYTRLLLGALALAVSFYYSLLFVGAGAVTSVDFIAALVFVTVTEGAKILFTGDCVYFAKTGQTEKAGWAGAVVAMLFMLSVSATAYNLIVGGSVERSSAIQSDTRYQNLKTSLSSIQEEIKAVQNALSACPSGHLIKCITPYTESLTKLRTEERQLLAQQGNIQPATGSSVFWAQISNLSGTSPATLEAGWAFLRGLLLEILGLVLVGQALSELRSVAVNEARRVSGQDLEHVQQVVAQVLPHILPVWNQTGDNPTNRQSLKLTTKSTGLVNSGKRAAGSFDTGTEPGQDTRYQTIKSEILAGKVSPSTNQLRQRYKCDYRTASGYLASMAAEGLLLQDTASRQYSLKV